MTAMVLEALASAVLVFGAGFTLIGSLALVRFTDVLARLHGPTKATTLGVGSIAIGSMLFFAAIGKLSVHELLVVAFMFLTAPVSAHLLARAALHRRKPQAGDSDSHTPRSESP